MASCPHCGQPIPETRFGVRLPPIKLRIFDAVARAGDDGIDADDLFNLIYPDDHVSRRTLKAHVWQLNDMLIEAEAGVFIAGMPGSGRRYTLKHGVPAVWPLPPLFERTGPPSIDFIMLEIKDRMQELLRED